MMSVCGLIAEIVAKMLASQRVRSNSKIAREVKSGSCDGGENVEYNVVGFVEIFKTLYVGCMFVLYLCIWFVLQWR